MSYQYTIPRMEFLLREINLPEYSDEEVKPMIRELAIALQAVIMKDSESYKNVSSVLATYKEATGDTLNDLVDILREELDTYNSSHL